MAPQRDLRAGGVDNHSDCFCLFCHPMLTLGSLPINFTALKHNKKSNNVKSRFTIWRHTVDRAGGFGLRDASIPKYGCFFVKSPNGLDPPPRHFLKITLRFFLRKFVNMP